MDRPPPPSPAKPGAAGSSPGQTASAPPPPPPPSTAPSADPSPPSSAPSPLPSPSGAAPPPPPPPPGPPPPSSPVITPKSGAAVSPSSPASSSPGGSGQGHMTPHSKLLNHVPLDSPDELDRKWYAHFYHMQKAIQGKDEHAAVAILKQQQPVEGSSAPPPLPFQPDIALLYAIITEPTLAKQYLRYLAAVAALDNYKTCIGFLQKLIDQKFVKLLVACRSQLLWLVRELVHLNAPGVDKAIICLMRYVTGGDPSRTTVWLASSIIRILIEHEAWLLSSSSLIPYVFHTFARVSLDHTATQHASLLKQEVDLCTTLWNRRQTDVAQLGREVVRILNDTKDVPGMNQLWKQLRNVRDNDAGADKESGILSVAQLMAVPTPPRYLAYRLSPKMEEDLLFMMERVQVSSVTRYQKWFSSQFLSAPGSDSLVPDLVRYICAVYHPSNQILGSKVTPRYHLLGWLYLLCHGSKTPSVLARVQLAMFFDFLYFKTTDNIMSVEPAILLMVKSLKSHPMVTLAMVQFLVFAVEKFAASPINNQLKQKGVSTVFTMVLKLGVVPSISSLQSFPLLQSSAPELTSELHRIFPEHFPSPEVLKSQPIPSPHSPVAPKVMGSPLGSPGLTSSPVRHPSDSPVRSSPVRGSPIDAGSPLTSPLRSQSPTHSDSSIASAATSSDTNSLGAMSFLPGNQLTVDTTPAIVTASADPVGSPVVTSPKQPTEAPVLVLELGAEDIKRFQDMMPEPCSRPTEGFLECLNDILISWIRHDNAIEIAAPLGSFLHASLDQIILSSRIGITDSPKATCAGIFDSMLDQVLSESHELFVPFLKAMLERDITISFRLLAFCCSRNLAKDPESALAPYAAFVQAVGSSVSQSIMKDMALSQQIDDARAQTLALLGKPLSASHSIDETDAIGAVVSVVAPYLFTHMNHPSLSKLAARSESFIQAVLSLANPASLHTMCMRITLRDFTVFKDRLANALLSSLQWSSWEQYGLWDLVIAEEQANQSTATEGQFMAAARKVLACVNPHENTETLSGLLKCLIQFRPDASILHSVWKLADTYEDFPLAVLSTWIDKFPEVVAQHVLSALEKAASSHEGVADPLIVPLLGKLNRLQIRRNEQLAVGGSSPRKSVAGDVYVALLKDEAVSVALRDLLKPEEHGRVKTEWPALAAVLFAEDEPPTKKQRVSDES